MNWNILAIVEYNWENRHYNCRPSCIDGNVDCLPVRQVYELWTSHQEPYKEYCRPTQMHNEDEIQAKRGNLIGTETEFWYTLYDRPTATVAIGADMYILVERQPDIIFSRPPPFSLKRQIDA